MHSNNHFSRKLRLLSPSDYKFVFDKPVRSSDKLLTILVRKNNLKNPRLGLAIAKKAVKTAVQRNRIKRIIREYFRSYKKKIACADYVVLVRYGIDKMDNRTIHNSIAKQFNYLRKKYQTNDLTSLEHKNPTQS
jgi:ribonuclease P protein component